MGRIVRILLICLAFCLSNSLYAQEQPNFDCYIIDYNGAVREQYVDFKKLVLNIKFNPNESYLAAVADYTFSPLRTQVKSLFLDAPNIKIESILLENKKVKFEYKDEGINIIFDEVLDWNKDYALKINYEANPKKGMYFIGWNDPTQRARKQIWTQGQSVNNRYWIPSFDAVNDKLITETIIEFEKGYEVISNGILKSKKDKAKTTTWHYAMEKPHSLYLIMLAIGEYAYKDYAASSGITSRQYYYKDKPEAEEPTYQYTNEMMDWFHKELGTPYQWQIYKNVPVQDFMYGAMENTSATIFTDYYLQNKREALERNYIGTNAHELAHHWFGNLVTEWSGKHHWLHESFATHYSKHFLKEILGDDEYQWKKRKEQLAALRAGAKNDLAIAHSEGGSSRHYAKGSFVLDMLRDVVGEEEFKKTVQAFLKENAFDMVDTHDFQQAFLKEVGMNLDWFFKQWVYKGGEPEFLVQYNAKKNKTIIELAQVQEQNDMIGLFKMPIDFEVHYKDGSVDKKTQWIEKQRETILIKNPRLKKVSFVLFDPNAIILKKVNFEKSYKELLAQAQYAPHMIDRYDAVKALESFDIEKKREDLIELYLLDDFRAIKQNILKQLKNDMHSKTQQLFVYAMGEKNVHIRKTAIENADISNKRYIKFYEELLEDDSYVVIEKALKKLCYEYPDNKDLYLLKTKNLEGNSHSLKLEWLNLSFEKNSKLAGGIVDYASESYDFRTRIKAINLIRQNNYYDSNYIKNLVNAYLSFNKRLKAEAAVHLNELLAEKESGIKVAKHINSLKLPPYQQKDLDSLLIKHKRKVY